MGGDLEREFTQEEAAHVEAEAAVISAEKRHNAGINEFMATQIKLCEAEQAQHEAEDVERGKKAEVARREAAMESAKRQLEVVQGHIAEFEALRQRERCTSRPSAASSNEKVTAEKSVAALQANAISAGA